MKARLEDALRLVSENSVVMTIFPRDSYSELNMHAVKVVSKGGAQKGAYLTMNKPYKSLTKLMEKSGINHGSMVFLDCVTQKEHEADNCVFLKSVESLTNIGISLNPIYKDPNLTFLFLDSLDALSVYHDQNTILKFTRSLIENIRENNMSGFMLGIHEDTDKRVIDEISLVCDHVIDLTK